VVGTHALIEDDVVLNDLGLVVVDEQHRFGSPSASACAQGSGHAQLPGHDGDPIPRSLALTVYGDVDVIELREMPRGGCRWRPGWSLPMSGTRPTTSFGAGVAGRQVFVICPLIEESDKWV